MKKVLIPLFLILATNVFSQYNVTSNPNGTVTIVKPSGSTVISTKSACLYARSFGLDKANIYTTDGQPLLNCDCSLDKIIVNGATFATQQELIDTLNSILTCGEAPVPEPFPTNLDITQTDTSLVNYKPLWERQNDSISENNDLLRALLQIPYDTTQIDTSLSSSPSDSLFIQALEQTNKDSLTVVIDLLTDLINEPDTSIRNYYPEWTRNNDTLSSILQALLNQSDTVFVSNDSIKVWFKQPIQILDNDFDTVLVINPTDTVYTIDSTYTAQLDRQNDSLSAILTELRNQIDTSYNPKFDSLITLLQKDTTTSMDTIKVPVFKTTLKQITTLDTLYNCNGLAFSWLSTATGSATFTDDNGNNLTINAGEVLPLFPSDGISFYNRIIVDATNAVGLVLNGKGCQDTDGNPCLELEILEDCGTGDPIISCEGWQSVNGIWQSTSGCWK